MASTLYENVEDWHSNEDRKDLLSSGEIESLQVKGDIEEHDDGYEEICPKQQPQDEKTERELDGMDGNAKENGHECSDENGNGIDEELDEDEVNDDEETVNGSKRDQDDQDKDESVETLAEMNGEEATSSVPYYGRTLVAPEYMNFLPPEFEETSQAGEGNEAEKDSPQSTLLKEFKDQIKGDRKEDQRAEETSVQTVENEKENEDDLSSPEEELDEVESEVEKKEDGGQSCTVERVEQSEGEEETVEEEKEEKEEGSDSSNGSKLTPLEEEGSPQLAQEEDDEDQSEGEEPEKDNEDIGIKEEDEKLGNGEEAGILTVEQTLEKGSEISPELAKVNDEDSDSDEEIDIEHEESGRKHSSSLKVQVHSPTPDVSEVGSAAQSFDAGEDQVTGQQDTAQEQSFNEIGKEEQERNLFSEPVETNDNYQDEDDVGHEAVDGETYQEGDSEEDREGGDETGAESCESDQEPADEVEAEVTDTFTEAPLKEDYAVHFSLQGQERESDLTGKVKELGRMFDGGGPVFPSPGRNNYEGVDGSPISVRKYKAIFEQDQNSVQGARDPGRREELINPPRGMVKNLRGFFENPQGLEARKG